VPVDVLGRGLTQQRCAPRPVLEVGMSPAVPLAVVSDRRSFVVIIGVDPHKRTHTASALEPRTHRVLAALQIDACGCPKLRTQPLTWCFLQIRVPA
jgi:hypothetical protein